MKAKFYTALLLLISVNGFAQKAADSEQIDSTLEQKFVLSFKNDVATTGRFKHLQVFINYDQVKKAYYISANSEKEIDCYLEIKDQDENVIFFKQVAIHEGVNFIPIETEDGTQTFFKLYFQNTNESSAVYVFRFVKEVTYSRR